MNSNNSNSEYRNLLNEEIGQLVHQGCSSTDWNLVKVSHDFIPDNIENCKLTGYIRLNSFTGTVNLIGGITFNTGIYNAWLHNCEIGKNALIHNVRSYIANYKIEEGVVIHNSIGPFKVIVNNGKAEGVHSCGGQLCQKKFLKNQSLHNLL